MAHKRKTFMFWWVLGQISISSFRYWSLVSMDGGELGGGAGGGLPRGKKSSLPASWGDAGTCHRAQPGWAIAACENSCGTIGNTRQG